jgi:hypothetical protein
MDEESQPPAKKSKRDNGKGTWLVTYSASSPDVTPEMLREHSVHCDECYAITWRESKYVLIHLKQSVRLRLSAMNKVMLELEKQYKVRGSSIIGYEPLASNERGQSSVTEHPAFMRMVELLNKGGDLTAWLEEGDVQSNKKGLLWKYIDGTDPKEKTHGQLVEQVKKWTPLIKEATETKAENEVLRLTLTIRERELLKANEIIKAQDAKNEKFFRDLLEKMRECTALKKRLIRHNIDHTWSKDSED